MSREIRDGWDSARTRGICRLHQAGRPGFRKKEFAKQLQVVGAMQKAGIGFLAGTDNNSMPGFSLHDELGFFVRAGLTPFEALQTATSNPARFFGKDKDVGAVEKGKIADLVLLDANPLDDIANTKKIASVICGGTLLSRAQLDKILSDAEESGRPSIADILIETIDEKDVTAANHQYYDMKSTQPDKYDFRVGELNNLGYRLLKAKRVPNTIEIFRLGTEVAPNDFNIWDSLAEGYMDHGDKELAIKNYKKSLELNPKNTKAMEKLTQLSTGD